MFSLPTIRKIFGDGIWQSVSVLVTVVLYLVGSPLIAPKGPENKVRELQISKIKSINLNAIPEALKDRTTILIDKKEEMNVRMDSYRIQFNGNKDRALMPEEIESLRGSVPEGRKVLLVTPSAKPEMIDLVTEDNTNEFVVKELKPPIKFEAEVTPDKVSFDIKRMIINHEDWFQLEVYSATADPVPTPNAKTNGKDYPNAKNSDTVGDLTWNVRIAAGEPRIELDPIGEKNKILLDRRNKTSLPVMLSTRVIMEGWAVYTWGALNIVNLILLLQLANGNGWMHFLNLRTALLIILFSVLSLASSEILTDWVVNGRGLYPFSLKHQPVISTILLSVNLIIISLMLARGLYLKYVSRFAGVPAGTDG